MTTKSDQLTPRRRPSQERSRDRVERILDATADLLGHTPVDKITTAAIAETAGVPIGSVYQYFPNKLAVLAELARRVMEEVDLKTASLIAEDFGVLPWDQAIDRAIDATMEGFATQPGYLQLLLSIRPTPGRRSFARSPTNRTNASRRCSRFIRLCRP
jgi:AcrR family transcriptional regulator